MVFKGDVIDSLNALFIFLSCPLVTHLFKTRDEEEPFKNCAGTSTYQSDFKQRSRFSATNVNT